MAWLAGGTTKQCEKCGGTIKTDNEIVEQPEEGEPVTREIERHLGSCNPPVVEEYAEAPKP
jgi:hypothetical protein